MLQTHLCSGSAHSRLSFSNLSRSLVLLLLLHTAPINILRGSILTLLLTLPWLGDACASTQSACVQPHRVKGTEQRGQHVLKARQHADNVRNGSSGISASNQPGHSVRAAGTDVIHRYALHEAVARRRSHECHDQGWHLDRVVPQRLGCLAQHTLHISRYILLLLLLLLLHFTIFLLSHGRTLDQVSQEGIRGATERSGDLRRRVPLHLGQRSFQHDPCVPRSKHCGSLVLGLLLDRCGGLSEVGGVD
jgi:hypothetical protein